MALLEHLLAAEEIQHRHTEGQAQREDGVETTIAESRFMIGRYSTTTASKTVLATLAGAEATTSFPASSLRLTRSNSRRERAWTQTTWFSPTYMSTSTVFTRRNRRPRAVAGRMARSHPHAPLPPASHRGASQACGDASVHGARGPHLRPVIRQLGAALRHLRLNADL